MTEPSACFEDVPRTPRGHLGLLFYEAAACVVLHLHNQAQASGKEARVVFENFPFLADYWNEIRRRLSAELPPDGLCAALTAECELWEVNAAHWLPLLALRQEAGLSRDALLCLVLTGLVEEDARFAELFSALQPASGHRRPTLGLLEAFMRSHGNDAATEAWSSCRPLVEAGVLQAINRESPRSEWTLRVPSPLWSALRGEHSAHPLPGVRYHAPETFCPVAELILPARELERLAELGPLLAAGMTRTLVVRGLPGSERLELIGSVARTLERGLLEIDVSAPANEERWPVIGPLCLLSRALPVLNLDPGPGETFEIPALTGYRGPMAVTMGREGGFTGPCADQCVTLNLEAETVEERLRHWQRWSSGCPQQDLDRIARRFALPARYIRQAAQLAGIYAAMERRAGITEADVRQAARTISRQRLDSLATRLAEGGEWSQLVVAQSTENDLLSLERRCRHRENLAAELNTGMPGGLNRGVRTLFEGPSGTGKTLAARILGTELGLDVYRVDLAAIVNKYIGETEKNLSRVLSRAEDLDVILLLDEGDALMSRRTEVKSAHDRYANLETNYLLQRLETYTGIVIITTNAGQHIDSAFRRRIDVVVKFHLPAAQERWRLWQLHLASESSVDADALERIALSFALTGGQIRNAAIHARLLALAAGRHRLTPDDLQEAINVEYRKAGAAFPVDHESSSAGEGKLTGFLSAIS
ncbi:MAG: ATP-binding protein [Acidobacteriia bacterium]|nr:ATP-binding protein [Terriglobia bacterium]